MSQLSSLPEDTKRDRIRVQGESHEDTGVMGTCDQEQMPDDCVPWPQGCALALS